ncbi:hypothetical protein FFLO_04761 [Filobasidium floriforme]|uniref:Uncharacterized protein n=2 Tax=Filobasidium floriforme TaxID=5210 RepID=A0A8K0NPK9_9TREE|nr:hypothetical protein FFLO_04761 [Filobasidium floriforme]
MLSNLRSVIDLVKTKIASIFSVANDAAMNHQTNAIIVIRLDRVSSDRKEVVHVITQMIRRDLCHDHDPWRATLVSGGRNGRDISFSRVDRSCDDVTSFSL